MKFHEHESTGDAYDASNCRDDHAHAGLVVELERVVGLAWAWPIAITAEHGALHTAKDDDASIESVMADAGYSPDDVRQAVDQAERRGWPVRPEFQRYAAKEIA